MSGPLHPQLLRALARDSVAAGRARGWSARLAAATFAAIVAVSGFGMMPASAHENLVRAAPGDGSTVTSAPARVKLVFDEKAGTPADIVVTGPSGEHVDRRPVRVADNTVSVRVEVHAAGWYSVSYRVVSADGHPVSGRSRFRFAPGGTAEAGSAQPATDEHAERAEPAAHADGGASGDSATSEGLGRGGVVGITAAGAALLAGIALLTVRRRPGGMVSSGSNPARKSGT